MRYFLDTEFLEDGKTIELISIGIVAEDGREFYAENLDLDTIRVSENKWLMENVWPHLWGLNTNNRTLGNAWSRDGGLGGLLDPRQIAGDVRRFCSIEEYGKPEFWGYYADYDWVVFCQLFGRMIDLPQGWPMWCNDLKQLSNAKGKGRLPQPTGTEHHALSDARWNRDMFKYIETFPEPPPLPIESGSEPEIGDIVVFDSGKWILSRSFEHVLHFTRGCLMCVTKEELSEMLRSGAARLEKAVKDV